MLQDLEDGIHPVYSAGAGSASSYKPGASSHAFSYHHPIPEDIHSTPGRRLTS